MRIFKSLDILWVNVKAKEYWGIVYESFFEDSSIYTENTILHCIIGKEYHELGECSKCKKGISAGIELLLKMEKMKL